MTKIYIVLLMILTIGFSTNLENLVVNGELEPTEEISFKIYKNYKAFGSKDDNYFANFHNSLKRIYVLNQDKTKTWTAGITKFAFMSDEEFLSGALGAQSCSQVTQQTLFEKRNLQDSKVFVPPAIDWRDQGIVTPVKDQRNCGASWAFSAVGAIESHMAIRLGSAPNILSEQQLVDCAGAFNNNGCNGGLPSQAFEYVKYNDGIEYGGVYMYEAAPLPKCYFNFENTGGYCSGGSVNITTNDEQALLEAVGTVGPVTAAFQATADFKFYTGGIYSNPSCSSSAQEVNHAALLVGYAADNGQQYWIAKNSWGDQWGENGYFRIARGSNMCGIASCASYPKVTAN